jgi:hypothetical protein
MLHLKWKSGQVLTAGPSATQQTAKASDMRLKAMVQHNKHTQKKKLGHAQEQGYHRSHR